MAHTSVEITANSSDYQSQMKSAAAQMKTLSAEYTTAATKAKLFGSETDSLKAKAESLTQKITVQKNIVKLNSEQQEELTKKLSDQATEHEELKIKIDAAKEAYEESTQETGKNSEQSKKLKEELEKLEEKLKANETAIGKTETALANQTVKTEKSKTALMNMEAELENVNKELKNHKWNEFASGCEKAGEKMESFGEKMSIVSGGILAFGTAVGKSALDTENDLMKMQGQLGLTAEETEKLKTVAQNLYTNGFGESLEDCSSAVVTLTQNVTGAKEMSVEQQQAIAEQMMTMQELFETENEELTRTLTTMLNNGVIDDISEGMDVLTVGFQNGANYSGELLDTMREYSPKFKELGLDAETAMAYLIQGAKNGAFNLDKVGDAMKEFSIRAVDGSDSTVEGFEKIGLNADEMAKKFSAGGDTAAQAFQETLVALKSLDDPMAQNAAGVDLFGTMWEDLGKDVVLSLADVEGGLQNVEGATTKAGEQINNSFSTEVQMQFRELQTSLLPLGNELLRLAKDVMPTVKEVVGQVTTALEGMDSETAQNVIKIGAVVAAVGPLAVGFGKAAKGISTTITTGQKFVSGAAKIIAKITAKTAATAAGTAADTAGTAATAAHTAATTAATATTGGMTAAQTALNAVMNMNPFAKVILIITALIAIGVALYKNWDKIKEFAGALWENIKEKFDAIKETITGAFTKAKEAVTNKVKEIGDNIKNSTVGQVTSKVFNNVKDTVHNVMSAAVGTAKEKLGNMKTAYEENGGGIKGVVAAGWEGIKGYYSAGFTFVDKLSGGKLSEIKSKFSEKTSEIKTKVSDGWENMKTTVTTKMTEWKTNASNKLNEIKSNFSTKVSEIKNNVSTGWENMKTTVTTKMTEWKNNATNKLTEIKSGFSSKVSEIKSKWSTDFANIKDKATSSMETAKQNVSTKLTNMKTAYSNAGGGIKGIVSASFTGVKDTMNSLMTAANTLTGGKLDSIKSAFSTKLASAKSTASSALDGIKSAFSSKLESAKSSVSGVLDKIKGLFNFSWSLPHLNLPHISVNGGKAPYGIGGKGSLPSFSIQWYKSGGIMTNPTVFGINGNSLMVGGEAGDEAILPLAEFYNKLNSILDKKLDAVQKSQVVYVTNHTYIDSDEIASRTVSKVDAEMVTNKRKGR